MKKLTQNSSRIVVLALLFLSPLTLMQYDDSRSFEVARNLDIFYNVFTEVTNSYVDEIPTEEFMTKAINGMLKNLDPYTVYYPQSEIEQAKLMVSGTYAGIGVTVSSKNKKVVIVEVLKNSPAHKAGLQMGDQIVEVDGHNIDDVIFETFQTLLRGQSGSKMNMVIVRNGERKPYSLTREIIESPIVPYSGLISGDVAYVKLNEFSENCTEKVKQAFQQLSQNGAKKFILDLRGNPGGLLNEAVNMVNLFVPRNERVVYTKGQYSDMTSQCVTRYEPTFPETPLAVLVDENSASASEIVAGSLQDFDRAVIIGNRTFGKGLVQIRKELKHNTMLKITTSKYYIPSGRCIQKLDYTNRDEKGKPTEIQQSSSQKYYTRNGREVLGGGGILPDHIVSTKTKSALLENLLLESVLFDYINTNYSAADTVRILPQTFRLTDSEYQKFVEFCQKSGFSYKSESEKYLDSFALKAQNEKILCKDAFDALCTQIDEQQKSLFEADKQLIMHELEANIIRTLHFEQGVTEFLTRGDSCITKALEVL